MPTNRPHLPAASVHNSPQQTDYAACNCGCIGSRALMLRKRTTRTIETPAPSVVGINASPQDKRNVKVTGTLRILGNVLSGIAVAFFPKCPVCWAGYMSLFGAIGIRSIPYTPQTLFLFIAGMAANLYLHYKLSRRKNRMGAFALNLAGVSAVVLGYFAGITLLNYTGLVIVVVSSLLINLPGLLARIHTEQRNAHRIAPEIAP